MINAEGTRPFDLKPEICTRADVTAKLAVAIIEGRSMGDDCPLDNAVKAILGSCLADLVILGNHPLPSFEPLQAMPLEDLELRKMAPKDDEPKAAHCGEVAQ
jgi:hypothetical protein